MTNVQQLQHLYWRAGFGPRPQDVAAGPGPRKALRQLLHDSAAFAPLDGPGLHYQVPPGAEMAAPAPRRRDLMPAQRKQKNQDVKQVFGNICLAWMERIATSPGQLREQMTLFWHGHFAYRVRRPEAALRLPTTGALPWDGTTDQGRKAAVGYYVFHIELFRPSGGEKREYKKMVVLGARF